MYFVKKEVNVKALLVISLILFSIGSLIGLIVGTTTLLAYGILLVIILVSMGVVYLGEKYL